MIPDMRRLITLMENPSEVRIIEKLASHHGSSYWSAPMSNDGAAMSKTMVDEQAVAKTGNWDSERSQVFTLSKFIFDANWHVVGSLNVGGQEYTIARLNDEDGVHFIVGRLGLTGENNLKPGVEEKPKFIGVLRIDMSSQDEIGSALGYANLHSVNSVGVKESQRGLGFAKLLYEWLVSNQSMTIIGDRVQYFGARRLWAALSKVVDSVVDIVDVKTKRILERDVTLHHGVYDHDFDNRVWSYGQEMAHVRVVLKQVR